MMVNIMRALQSVSINGITGLGYAEVIRTPGNVEECRGVIVFDEEVDLDALELVLQEEEGVYSGIVYAGSGMQTATFPIQIRHLEHDTEDPGATFVARAMPA